MNEEIRYAVLTHYTKNLGDDIQSLATMQFLPRVDYYINRDFLDRMPKVDSNVRIRIIMNGWFAHRTKGWPLPDFLDPLFISFHLNPSRAGEFLKNRTMEYLKRFTIGCRDLWTTEFLKKYGIDSYFSGCLTLTLDEKYKSLEKDDYTLIVDIPNFILEQLPRKILQYSVIRTNQIMYGPKDKIWRKISRKLFPNLYWSIALKKQAQIPINPRFSLAECRMKEIARAQLVITSRLHIAMPAVSLGVPTILVHENLTDPRFSGLIDFVNAYDYEGFLSKINKIDWSSIENPNQHKLESLKQSLKSTVKHFLET